MRAFLSYDISTIPKHAPLINGIVLVTSTVTALSCVSAVWYQLAGWPRGIVGALIFLITSVVIAIRVTAKIPRTALPPRTATQAWFINICLAVAYLGLATYLGTHHSSEWVGSIFQVIPRRIFLLWGVLASISVILWIRNSLHLINQLFFGILLFGFVQFVFTRGFGFDVFVHEATVRAWLSAGFIAPRSLLYTGFYGVVATIASLTRMQPFEIITWLTPFVGAMLLIFIGAWGHITRREPVMFLLAILATFQSLFVTSTPQALGHLLLLFLLALVWLGKEHTITTPWQLMVMAFGIATIHPLSGIPAIALVVAVLGQKYLSHTRAHVIVFFSALFIAFLPAALIMFTSPGASFRAFSMTDVWSLVFAQRHAFQATALTRLAYALHACILLGTIFIALYGAMRKKISSHAHVFFVLSVAAFISALCLRAISIPAIISYEQSDFAARLLIVALFFALPAVSETLASLYTKRYVMPMLLALGLISWYVAQTPWNTIVQTKAIQAAPQDFSLVRDIDARANGKTYIVLADQVTSAAALHEFGFLDRQLPPPRTFYFYPIPTGDILYSKYFLPQMYNGISRAMLIEAARAAGVHDVFFVIKPYWHADDATVETLKTNTTDWWTVGGVVIGHLST